MAAHGQRGSDTQLALLHCHVFPFTHCSVENAKIPNNAVEKTYREGQGCTQKAQVGQYVTQQST